MTDEATAAQRFSRPPRSFTDGRDRAIEIGVADDADSEAVVEMYAAYTDADRAQGIPPRERRDVAEWVDTMLDDGINLVAWHGEDAVGHAALFPYDETAELVIFVHPDYHYAGIGSRLIRALLGAGQRAGLDHVWLSVQRDNHVAMNLYRSVGFETTRRERNEHEMELDL
ncbi:GNAT family N-acetyltransferase [Halomicrobium sp. LC1Hm]|uniref:GNAT family N-acetyltransferase n=1 Tax=Halomicrobium sp. LC1Hm TaxID=2610902 RepID=UPI0012983AAE|nr:GNAT family N-acetyltransferase [Halomicrobium sp. LC1Hm]QGA81582.1 Acetyltransferase (GNAT) family [Halomicrobium sp. LC1Hm]